MKNVSVILILLFSYACKAQERCTAPLDRDYDRFKEIVRGNVKTIRTSGITSHNFRWSKTVSLDSAVAINGKIYQVDSFSRDGHKLLNYRIQQGNLTERYNINVDDQGKITQVE